MARVLANRLPLSGRITADGRPSGSVARNLKIFRNRTDSAARARRPTEQERRRHGPGACATVTERLRRQRERRNDEYGYPVRPAGKPLRGTRGGWTAGARGRIARDEPVGHR